VVSGGSPHFVSRGRLVVEGSALGRPDLRGSAPQAPRCERPSGSFARWYRGEMNVSRISPLELDDVHSSTQFMLRCFSDSFAA
jgi:hypothetical protein